VHNTARCDLTACVSEIVTNAGFHISHEIITEIKNHNNTIFIGSLSSNDMLLEIFGHGYGIVGLPSRPVSHSHNRIVCTTFPRNFSLMLPTAGGISIRRVREEFHAPFLHLPSI
jgi:hypothetical protein